MSSRSLFNPLKAGHMQLQHRCILAPLTRRRAAEPSLAPTDLHVEYYRQRASKGGLLITEATHVSIESLAYSRSPGIWTNEQVSGWKKVTDAVHKEGGYISCQLWHTGRVAAVEDGSFAKHPLVDPVHVPGVSSSNKAAVITTKDGTTIPFPSDATYSETGKSQLSAPRPLRTDEIPRLVEDYRHAARCAKKAGFDAVEIHGAHGYLLDQFLSKTTNDRTDKYGGDVHGRSRLMLEVVEAVTEEFGEGGVALRLSPTSESTMEYHGNGYDESVYKHVVGELNRYKLAYLLLTEPRWYFGAHDGDHKSDPGFAVPVYNAEYRKLYKGILLGGGGFTPLAAAKAVAEGTYDGITFGRWFISNPDLPARLEKGLPLNVYDRKTFYSDGSEGYTDYLSYDKAVAAGVDMCEQADIGASLSTSKIAKAGA